MESTKHRKTAKPTFSLSTALHSIHWATAYVWPCFITDTKQPSQRKLAKHQTESINMERQQSQDSLDRRTWTTNKHLFLCKLVNTPCIHVECVWDTHSLVQLWNLLYVSLTLCGGVEKKHYESQHNLSLCNKQ